jgi:hypothetical protein
MLIETDRDNQLTATFGEGTAKGDLDGWTGLFSVYLTIILSTAKATHTLFHAD